MAQELAEDALASPRHWNAAVVRLRLIDDEGLHNHFLRLLLVVVASIRHSGTDKPLQEPRCLLVRPLQRSNCFWHRLPTNHLGYEIYLLGSDANGAE